MTIKELKKLIKGLPKDMKVVIGMGESLEDICPVSSQPLMFEFNDGSGKEMVFVLSECTCEDSSEEESRVYTGTQEEIIAQLTGTVIHKN